MLRSKTPRAEGRFRPWATVVTCLPVVALITLAAAPARSGSLEYGFRLTSVYDDNLLDYSARDLDEFLKGINPPRFNLETSDDLSFQSRFELTWRGSSRRPVTWQLHATDSRQLRNALRTHQSYSVRVRTPLAGQGSVSLSLAYLPRYYLRTLWEDDLPVPYRKLPRYRPAEYRRYGLGASITRRLPGLRARFSFDHHRSNYLDGFPERDSNSDSVDLSVSPRGLGALRGSFRGGYRRVSARGRDGDETASAPDDPDVSSHSIGIGGSMTWVLRDEMPTLLLRQALDYHVRSFTTQDTKDLFHYRREDRGFTGNWGFILGIGGEWKLRGSYELAEQRTGSLPDASESGADAGDFTSHRVSLGLGWSFRGTRGDEGDDE